MKRKTGRKKLLCFVMSILLVVPLCPVTVRAYDIAVGNSYTTDTSGGTATTPDCENGIHLFRNGECTLCGEIEVKDMKESLKSIDTPTALPASFDYASRKDKTRYTDANGKEVRAKLLRVDVNEAGRHLQIKMHCIAGHNTYVQGMYPNDTRRNGTIYLYKEVDNELVFVGSSCVEQYNYFLTEAGSYYIAFGESDYIDDGVYHIDISLMDMPRIVDMTEGLRELETLENLPYEFTYELGSEKTCYKVQEDDYRYGKLLKINVPAAGKRLKVLFSNRRYADCSGITLYKEVQDNFQLIASTDNYLQYDIEEPGDYYIALMGKGQNVTGLCDAGIYVTESDRNITLEEGMKEVEDISALPVKEDYILGVDNTLYSGRYGKIFKVKVEADKAYFDISFKGKNNKINTSINIYKENEDGTFTLCHVITTGELSRGYSTGTYYIALLGGPNTDTGLCEMKVNVTNAKNLLESVKNESVPVSIPYSADVVLEEDEPLYVDYRGNYFNGRIYKVDVNDITNPLIVVTKDEYATTTRTYIYKENGENLELVDSKWGEDYIEELLSETGTYYIVVGSPDPNAIDSFHVSIMMPKIADLQESLKKVTTYTPMPSEFEYEFGSEDVRYYNFYDYAVYGKLLKVNIPKANTLLTINYDDMDVFTQFRIFKETDSTLTEVVSGTGDVKNIFREPGVYYIALLGNDARTAGSCHAKLSAVELSNVEYEQLDFTQESLPQPDENSLWNWNNATKTLTLKDGFVIWGQEQDSIILPEDAILELEGSTLIGGWGGLAGVGKLTIQSSNSANQRCEIYTQENAGLVTYEDLIINDCDLRINNCIYSSGDILVTGGRLVVESGYIGNPAVEGYDIIISDTIIDLKMKSNYYPLFSETFKFSLSGELIMSDWKGDELYRGPWKDELGSDYALCVDESIVNRVQSIYQHEWKTSWEQTGTHHWHECESKYCDITKDEDKNGYGVHESKVINAVKSTEAKDGYTGDKVCKVCGYEMGKGTVIPKVSSVALSDSTYIYDGKAKTPTVTVKDRTGKELKKDRDYTVSYQNGRVNTGTYKVTVTLKGNYSGTKTLAFKINPKAVTTTVTLAQTSYVYDGKVKTPAVTVKLGNTVLSTGNYTITYPTGRKEIGTYKVTVTLKGNYSGSVTKSFAIVPGKVTGLKQWTSAYSTCRIKMSWAKVVGADGYAMYRATEKDGTYKLVKTITETTCTNEGLKAGSKFYYKIRAYKTVDGKKYFGEYSDVKCMVTKPAAPAVTLTVGSKSAKIAWTQSAAANGYEVYMSTNKEGTYTQIKTANASTLSYTKTGLKSGQKYYIKVRAYTTLYDGSKVYSGWSPLKGVIPE